MRTFAATNFTPPMSDPIHLQDDEDDYEYDDNWDIDDDFDEE